MENYEHLLKSFLKEKLVQLCEEQNLISAGNREDLIKRLVENYNYADNNSIIDFTKNNSSDDTSVINVLSEIPPNANNNLGCNGQPTGELKSNDNLGENMDSKFNELLYKMKLMEKEIELLNKEKELLLRENEIKISCVESKNTVPDKNYVTKNISFIENLLNDFSPQSDSSNFMMWLTNVKTIQNKYKIDDDLMKILIVKKLKDKALVWFHSKPEHLNISFCELIDNMEVMFGHRTRRLELRQKFENRYWKFNESFADYFHDKIILSGDLDFTDEELVDFIIDGIKDVNLANQVKMHQFSNPNEMLLACGSIVLSGTTKFVSKEFRRNNYSGPPTKPVYSKFISNRNKTIPNAGPVQHANDQSTAKSYRCYNCNTPGHTYDRCPKPKRPKNSCYNCGGEGHSFRQCPDKQKSSE